MRNTSGHLETFATRARNRRLDLLFDTRGYFTTSSRTLPSDLILPLHYKLQRIHLKLNWNECRSFGLPANNTFPLLTSLFIDIHDSYRLQEPELIGLVDSFGTLPTLENLTLHAPHTSGDGLLSMVPWPQLTFLDFRVAVKAVTAQQILLQAQRLQTLIVGVEYSPDILTILPIQVLPELRSIKVSTAHRNATTAFFQPFSFPNLKSFSLDAYEESQDVLLDLHAQSGFRLEELELAGLQVETDDAISFLRLQPSLIHLSLNYCTCLDNSLFASLTYNPLAATPSISLLLLQTFKLERITDSLDGNVFVGMVESLSAPAEDRLTGHPFSRLTRIDLWFDGARFDSDIESRLATLSATGFLQDYCVRSDGPSDDSDWSRPIVPGPSNYCSPLLLNFCPTTRIIYISPQTVLDISTSGPIIIVMYHLRHYTVTLPAHRV
ncbi:hypothetical protein C8J57DRAFT_1257021 [Mycena rebaudengoi]|nr:hypothetical protein C8J57DRAFT_1257021 [Mycena rebaudengoi]